LVISSSFEDPVAKPAREGANMTFKENSAEKA
jgi:hypothetical protein